MIIMCENRPSSVSQTELAERGTCGGGFGLPRARITTCSYRILVPVFEYYTSTGCTYLVVHVPVGSYEDVRLYAVHSYCCTCTCVQLYRYRIIGDFILIILIGLPTST